MKCRNCGHELDPGQLTCTLCRQETGLAALAPEVREEIDALYARAWTHRQLGLFDEAIASCRELILVAPMWAEGYALLGEIHADQQHLQDAVQCYKKVREFAPQDVAYRERFDALIALAFQTPTITTPPAVQEPRMDRAKPKIPSGAQVTAARPARNNTVLFVGIGAVLALILVGSGVKYVLPTVTGAHETPPTALAPVGVQTSKEPEAKDVHRPFAPPTTTPSTPEDRWALPSSTSEHAPASPATSTPSSPAAGKGHDTSSALPTVVLVPDCRGKHRDDARALLEEKGLGVQEQTEVTSVTREGLVLRTEPRAGSHCPSGSTITVVVATPPLIPNVFGLSPEEAKKVLRADGLEIDGINEVSNEDVASGQVVKTIPPAGDPIPRKHTVTLLVAQ